MHMLWCRREEWRKEVDSRIALIKVTNAERWGGVGWRAFCGVFVTGTVTVVAVPAMIVVSVVSLYVLLP